jgi:hypothetical protein
MEKDPDDVEYGWKLLSETFRTMKQYASQADAKLYIIFIPHDVQTSQTLYESAVRKYGHDPSDFDIEKPNRKLAELCEKLEIDYLDLLPAMREETSNGNQLYFTRDGHWNAEGHRITAREIYKDIKNRGWIK